MTDFETIVTSIVALEPCYGTQGGNATRIYTRQGEILEDKRRLLTILKKTVRYYSLDLTSLRQNYATYLGCNQNAPLPLSAQLVLVPLKMRQPLVENDGADGYVNVCAIIDITDVINEMNGAITGCRLHLIGGHSVTCLFSRKTTEKRTTAGRLALDRRLALQGYSSGESFIREKANEGTDDYVLEIIKKLLLYLLQKMG
ncbi:MAG TPA: hypothetical protein VLH18_03350 [Candidatus Limnocylindrales bacterium]|nr:hypothetical protein [Candidatus Limnocylindrales bacterium]